MPGPNRRARLRRGSTIEIDHFRAEEDEAKFKIPKFQPLSSRYKKLEDKRIKEEEKAKLKKPKKQDSEENESQENAEEAKENEVTIGQTSSQWTPEEDELLKDKVSKFGTQNWVIIARFLKGRLGRQCRERWHNVLDPSIVRRDWTAEEDQFIIKMQAEIGSKWA